MYNFPQLREVIENIPHIRKVIEHFSLRVLYLFCLKVDISNYKLGWDLNLICLITIKIVQIYIKGVVFIVVTDNGDILYLSGIYHMLHNPCFFQPE